MTATQPDSQEDRRLGRRTFVKGLGVAGAGAVGLSGRGRFGAVGSAEAVAPLVAGAIGTAVAVEWALREFDVVGSDAPPEGLTADALKQQVYQTARTRKSTNASTIVDNQNILDGVEHTAYTDAKVAAIEELNAGSSESDVLAAANDSVDSYHTTIQSNLLKSWNESVREVRNLAKALNDHPDINARGGNRASSPKTDLFAFDFREPSYQGGQWEFTDADFNDGVTESYELADGTTLDVERFRLTYSVTDTNDDSTNSVRPYWSPLEDSLQENTVSNGDPGGGEFRSEQLPVSFDGNTVTYLNREDWRSIFTEINTTFEDVRDGISTWVSSVYGDVQSGEIEISDLLTPRERAAIMADEEGGSQAVADLIALNVPVDLENEATITIPSTGLNLRGSFGLTNESDGPLEAGTQYDPSTFSGDVYFTTDLSLLEGDWTAFETGVDGGTITITQEPYEGTILSVTTTADETVDVPATEWTDNGDGTWSYDASNELENPITEVASVSYYSEAESTQYETLNLKNPFNIESFENTETGEETQQASFTSAEPQNDSNYVSQEEWNQLEQQNQELIDKYEESQNSGGGAGGGFFSGESPDIGLIAAVVGAAGVVYALIGQGES